MLHVIRISWLLFCLILSCKETDNLNVYTAVIVCKSDSTVKVAYATTTISKRLDMDKYERSKTYSRIIREANNNLTIQCPKCICEETMLKLIDKKYFYVYNDNGIVFSDKDLGESKKSNLIFTNYGRD